MVFNMQNDQEERLYAIQRNDEYGIRAGRMDGQQVMIRFSPESYLILLFSGQGDLCSIQTLPYELDNVRAAQNSIMHRLNSDNAIEIKQFFLEDRFLGIRDLPSSLQETMDEQHELDDEELAFFQEELDSWRETDQFVLHWDNEYYLNNEGRVVAS